MPTHAYELEMIYHLKSYRTPWLDSFFIFCNFFDTVYFFMLLLPTVWLFFSRKVAFNMFLIFVLSWIANKALKYTFDLPRPNHLDPTLGLLNPTSPGFPSGAAQTAALMCGIIIKEWKGLWRWIVGPLFAIILSFSRLYLGVHFPTDILGGWIVGISLFWIYLKLDRINWPWPIE